MADETELRMNLVAIKRVDPYAKEIVNSSAHVAFYVFNNSENEWEKTDIEGALFVYKRYAMPWHSIFINNRLNTNSLVEPIRGQIELQSKPPFLLYRNERSRIRGFWFYNNSECDRIGEVIKKLVAECTESNGEPRPSVNGGPAGGPPGTDIFSMLTKAQEDFQNNSTNPGSKPLLEHQQAMMSGGIPAVVMTPQQQQQQQQQQLQQQQQQQQQQQISNQNAPRSVVNFFAAAKQPAASEVPLFKTLAPVHTLEQIEKQHRASTPLKDATGATVAPSGTGGKVTPEASELESSFKRMGIPIVTNSGASNGAGGMMGNGPQTPSGLPELGTSPLATFLSAANLSGAIRANNQPVVPKTKLIEISELESRQNQQQQQQTPLHELLKKSEGGAGASGGATVVKPALMPPTMFKPSSQPGTLGGLFSSLGSSPAANSSPSSATTQANVVSAGGNGTPGGGQQKPPTNAQGTSANATPGVGKNQPKSSSTPGNRQREANNGNSTSKGAPTSTATKTTADMLSKAASKTNSNLINNNSIGGSGIEPLTQNQLIQAVSYLIKHDPDFVRKLHEAYVKSFTEMISN